MTKNKYPGKCQYCGHVVKRRAGLLLGRRGAWSVAHRACHEFIEDDSGIVVTTFSSGESVYRNKRGRCEDAPCCGCCS
jgi:hypothetical protein